MDGRNQPTKKDSTVAGSVSEIDGVCLFKKTKINDSILLFVIETAL